MSNRTRLKASDCVAAVPAYPHTRLVKGGVKQLSKLVWEAEVTRQSAKDEAQELLRQTETACARQLAEARADAESIIASAQQAAADCRSQAASDSESIRTRALESALADGASLVASLVARLGAEIDASRRLLEHELAPLAIAIARRILHVELAVRPAALAEIVTSMLRQVSYYREVTLVVGQADESELAPLRAELSALARHAQRVDIRVDRTLPRFAVRLETERGALDGSLEVQLERYQRCIQDSCASAARAE